MHLQHPPAEPSTLGEAQVQLPRRDSGQQPTVAPNLGRYGKQQTSLEHGPNRRAHGQSGSKTALSHLHPWSSGGHPADTGDVRERDQATDCQDYHRRNTHFPGGSSSHRQDEGANEPAHSHQKHSVTTLSRSGQPPDQRQSKPRHVSGHPATPHKAGNTATAIQGNLNRYSREQATGAYHGRVGL